jgi:thioredoxin 1
MTAELLKFEAEWCGPCSQQSDLLEGYDATSVRSIDVDENAKLANQYSVRGLPTMVLIDGDGGVIDRWAGLTQPSEIEEVVDNI